MQHIKLLLNSLVLNVCIVRSSSLVHQRSVWAKASTDGEALVEHLYGNTVPVTVILRICGVKSWSGQLISCVCLTTISEGDLPECSIKLLIWAYRHTHTVWEENKGGWSYSWRDCVQDEIINQLLSHADGRWSFKTGAAVMKQHQSGHVGALPVCLPDLPVDLSVFTDISHK